MDWYTLFKFLHVTSAIIWLGSGLGLVILGIFAERARDNEQFGRVIANVTFMAPRVFVPASIGALVFGAAAAWLGSWYGQLWIWLGLAGFAATFFTGNFILKPRAEAVEKVVKQEGYSDRAVAMGSDLLSIAKFDFFMLFVVVADMVFKPSLGDWLLLVILAVLLAGAAALFLMPVMRKPMPAVIPSR